MATPLRRAASLGVGWLADRRIPTFLRAPVYRGYARLTGADVGEARGPLDIYPSLGSFFVRRLLPGARPVDADPGALVSPVDCSLQDLSRIEQDSVLQAKGRLYSVRDLLGGVGAQLELEGGHAWTLYLGPKDYHRIHCPEAGRLVEVTPVRGTRYSVAPRVLERRAVLSINERCALRIETLRGPLLMVLVGALNVGRIRVQGVPREHSGVLPTALERGRGEELARFEMGSTVVLITPPGMAAPCSGLAQGDALRLGRPLGRYL